MSERGEFAQRAGVEGEGLFAKMGAHGRDLRVQQERMRIGHREANLTHELSGA